MATRVAVIGAGAWGINFVRVLAHEPRCDLAAVVDPDAGVRQRVAAIRSGIEITNDVDRVLADRSIDAIVIASPSGTHADLACAGFAAGKHVLVEKPLAFTVAAAAKVVAAQRASGRVGMVGHLMAYHPAIDELRRLVRGGELGRLHYVHSTRANLGRLRRDENALWSFGPHDLSMLERVIDQQPTTVSARGQCVTYDGVEDVVFVVLGYASGAMAHLHLSRISPHKERRFTLVGARRVAELDDVSPEKLRIYDRAYEAPPTFTQFAQFLAIRDGEVRIPRIAMTEPLVLEVQHFLDCIETGASPLTDISSGARVVAILAAAQASLERGGLITSLEHTGF